MATFVAGLGGICSGGRQTVARRCEAVRWRVRRASVMSASASSGNGATEVLSAQAKEEEEEEEETEKPHSAYQLSIGERARTVVQTCGSVSGGQLQKQREKQAVMPAFLPQLDVHVTHRVMPPLLLRRLHSLRPTGNSLHFISPARRSAVRLTC